MDLLHLFSSLTIATNFFHAPRFAKKKTHNFSHLWWVTHELESRRTEIIPLKITASREELTPGRRVLKEWKITFPCKHLPERDKEKSCPKQLCKGLQGTSSLWSFQNPSRKHWDTLPTVLPAFLRVAWFPWSSVHEIAGVLTAAWRCEQSTRGHFHPICFKPFISLDRIWSGNVQCHSGIQDSLLCQWLVVGPILFVYLYVWGLYLVVLQATADSGSRGPRGARLWVNHRQGLVA